VLVSARTRSEAEVSWRVAGVLCEHREAMCLHQTEGLSPQPRLRASWARQNALLPTAVFPLISVPDLIQCSKLSTDSALLGGRNPTCFLIWGFAVSCSAVWGVGLLLCLPLQAIRAPTYLGERVSCRGLGQIEFCHLFCLPCVQGEGQTDVEHLPCIRAASISRCAAVGAHLRAPGKAVAHQSRGLNS